MADKDKVFSLPKGVMSMRIANHSYDKKIFRLLYILNKLDKERALTSGELAEEFNVSLRTVQRDIELLNMTGFPLVNMEKGSYSFAEGFSLKKMMVTPDEACLIPCFYELAKTFGERFEHSFKNILNRMLSKESASIYYAKIPEGVKIKHDKIVTDLESAIRNNNKIKIKYIKPDRKDHRILEPLKIALYDGFWYLLSVSDKEKALVKSRIDYIKTVTETGERFMPMTGFDMLLDESVNIWFEGKPKTARLKVSAEAAPYFEARKSVSELEYEREMIENES